VEEQKEREKEKGSVTSSATPVRSTRFSSGVTSSPVRTSAARISSRPHDDSWPAVARHEKDGRVVPWPLSYVDGLTVDNLESAIVDTEQHLKRLRGLHSAMN
jgi:hypothetical protein